jgi:hypothetical protein
VKAQIDYRDTGMPPADTKRATCTCGALYLDYPAGARAHRAVFGHNPIRTQPQERDA